MRINKLFFKYNISLFTVGIYSWYWLLDIVFLSIVQAFTNLISTIKEKFCYNLLKVRKESTFEYVSAISHSYNLDTSNILFFF